MHFGRILSALERDVLTSLHAELFVCVIRRIESICIPARKEENVEGYLNWVKTIHARFKFNAARNSQCYERPRKIPVT